MLIECICVNIVVGRLALLQMLDDGDDDDDDDEVVTSSEIYVSIVAHTRHIAINVLKTTKGCR